MLNLPIRKIIHTGILLLFMQLATMFLEVTHASLYQAEIDVPNRTKEARSVAIRVGLTEVILRITGDNNVLSTNEINNLFANPASLLQSYGYSGENDQLIIKMNFNEKQITKKLLELDINLWIKRPSIIAWIFINGQSINQSPPESIKSIQKTMTEQARKLGLPMAFPIWDLQEEQTFASNPFGAQSRDTIEELSKRYAKEVILVGDLEQSDERWRIVWTLYTDSEVQHWVAKGDNQEFAIKSGLKDVAQLLRERFDIGQSFGLIKMLVTVKNVHSSKEYKEIQKYFNKLSIVESVNIISLNRKDVTFSVTLTQDIEKFKEIVQLNDQLEELDSGTDNHLLFRYNL